MSPSGPLRVHVETPAGKPLGDLMNEMRAWLDSQNIQPAEFKPASSETDMGFEIAFHHEDHAQRFRARFGY